MRRMLEHGQGWGFHSFLGGQFAQQTQVLLLVSMSVIMRVVLFAVAKEKL